MKKKESSICLLQCVCLTKLFMRKLLKLNGNMLKDFKTVLNTRSIPYDHDVSWDYRKVVQGCRVEICSCS